MTKAVICPKCKNGVCLSQPEDHSECVPSGKCSNCEALIILVNHYSLKDAYPIVVQ